MQRLLRKCLPNFMATTNVRYSRVSKSTVGGYASRQIGPFAESLPPPVVAGTVLSVSIKPLIIPVIF
ncbi:hypothetical protein BABINDRAFT_72666 [Babjeviella inositovora NRRL Y-12698]|uniref:Uncharacterized protein n=1 Tax=Babjeviella inositovora NRRL Y-12698 TaxID=984486 RepID=A0A1E3QXS6_9ASCO|nr:uncharacterized protein BABINDRAFT_72666 [Babjeviella inositovora NRRL Y-12698]ODQ82456.1 hypothetical protein BABINDRAFT_72666 [Babjeviella inositovora NRRL Y-12698]